MDLTPDDDAAQQVVHFTQQRTFTPTMQLRWLSACCDPENGHGRMLQQAWQCIYTGEVEWREIPEV